MFEEMAEEAALKAWKTLQKYRQLKGNFIYDLTGELMEPVGVIFEHYKQKQIVAAYHSRV